MRSLDVTQNIDEPEERAKEAHRLIEEHQNSINELMRIRREAMEELTQSGMSNSRIATLLGMSRGRVSQLTSAGPPPERAFLGSGTVTVALGGKRDADNPDRPAVATEDFHAYEMLAKFAGDMQLSTEYEIIQPPGIVRLNRDNLVVICGPRLSPLVAQMLESDPHLQFDKDDAWHLRDLTEGTEFRSPMDAGNPGDVAYLGRLPRPDGRGTFLYVAGIHAMGAAGVVHYLRQNLGELYREVRLKRFSTLIECGYDPDTRQVLTSQRVAPIYRHDGS